MIRSSRGVCNKSTNLREHSLAGEKPKVWWWVTIDRLATPLPRVVVDIFLQYWSLPDNNRLVDVDGNKTKQRVLMVNAKEWIPQRDDCQ